MNEMFRSAQKNHVCQLCSLMGRGSIYKIIFPLKIKWNVQFYTENLFATPHHPQCRWRCQCINISFARNWMKYSDLDRKVMFTKPPPLLGEEGIGVNFQDYHFARIEWHIQVFTEVKSPLMSMEEGKFIKITCLLWIKWKIEICMQHVC